MIPNLLEKNQAQELIKFHREHDHLYRIGNEREYLGIRFMHIHTQWIRDLLIRVSYDLVGEIRKISDQVVWPEMIAINEWPIGGEQHPHVDTYSNQEMNHQTTIDRPAREWTCILYLNDDFRGGRTYIPEGQEMNFDGVVRDYQYQVFEPEACAGLLFQGIYLPHGVEKIRRNSRYTVSFWFSSSPEKQMMMQPVHDLNLDEDSWRLAMKEDGRI